MLAGADEWSAEKQQQVLREKVTLLKLKIDSVNRVTRTSVQTPYLGQVLKCSCKKTPRKSY